MPSEKTPMHAIDVSINRLTRNWTPKQLLGRILWTLVQPLFSCSPRIFWAWRRGLLRLFGAKVGRNVHIYPSVKIVIPWNLTIGDWSAIGFDALIYNLGPVHIGQRTTISQRTHLCAGTHDHLDPAMPLIKSSIDVADDAWVCADAFVGPDTKVAAGAVVGARSVVIKDVAPWSIVAGNPARPVGTRVMKGASAK